MYPNSENITERLELINQLKNFLVNAPEGQQEPIKQHILTPNESISCVKWNDAYYISGTDIVRSLVFRFHTFGRPIKHLKKFEEGIFSDLRNLKPGVDAILEEPKSAFLDLLFQNNCIRTQKKQKVFYWHSVPHDRLFLDALERDLKREKMGVEPTSVAVAHPAIAISLDTTQAMFDNFRKSILSELNLGPFYHHTQHSPPASVCSSATDDNESLTSDSSISPDNTIASLAVSRKNDLRKLSSASSTIFGQFSLFEGSPTYKQRRRRVTLNNQQQQQKQKQTTQLEDNNNFSDIRDRGISSSPSPPDHSYNNNEDESTNSLWRNGSSSSTSNNNTDDDTTGGSTRFFRCPLNTCDKYFKRLEHMKRHLRTHTMERPYMCDVCGKRFSRSDNLAQHKKTHDRNKSSRGNSVQPSSRPQSSKKNANNMNSTGVKTSRSTGGFLSKSINKSFPGRQRNLMGGNSQGSNSTSYGRSHTTRGNTTPSRGSSLPLPTASNRGRTLRRNAHHQRRQPYQHHSTRGNNTVEAEVIYESDWPEHHGGIEYLKSEPEYKEQILQPELSISTTSSSSLSSCNTSPTCTRLPIIKVEDVEPFCDLQSQHQQQTEDTAMMMVEEFLPQQHQYCWEDESASDWQRRVDWNQYSSPGTVAENYDTEDLIMEQQESLTSFSNYYYLNQPSHYSHYDVSNASSCLASPTMVPSFLIDTTTTSTTNSTATTAVNSPIMRNTEFHPSHYFSIESPTITPSDALLQRH